MEQQRTSKPLRRGYTTGSCAAAAAKTAVQLLMGVAAPAEQTICTPGGARLTLPIASAVCEHGIALCAVRKDAGDDPDVTNGVLVYAQARLAGNIVTIDGGEGVGRVTRAGLDQPIGAAAINRIPREMITREVSEVLVGFDSASGVQVVISIPDGKQLAVQTYNTRLGIEGGLSILGTTGIVEPMSEAALVDTIYTELRMLRAQSSGTILITPGSYGERFCRENLDIPMGRCALCSNYLGDTLDYAAVCGFEDVLLVGHIGKLVKLAGGIFNTHSRVADARMEILAAHAALSGAPHTLISALLGGECVTTDAAIDLIAQAGALQEIMDSLLEKCEQHLRYRLKELTVGVLLFSNTRGVLGATKTAKRQIECMKEGKIRE